MFNGDMSVLMPELGVYLSGGGAKAAFQVGSLKAFSQIIEELGVSPGVIQGVSAGAINAATIAQYSDNWQRGVSELSARWERFSPSDVYRVQLWSSAVSVLLGKTSRGLIDPTPLRRLLTQSINFDVVRSKIDAGHLDSLIINVFNLNEARNISVVEAAEWYESKENIYWSGQLSKQRMTTDHLMASAAIPYLFPTVQIDGKGYVDGGVDDVHSIKLLNSLGVKKVIAFIMDPKEKTEASTGLSSLLRVMFPSYEKTLLSSEQVKTDVFVIQPEKSMLGVALKYVERLPRNIRSFVVKNGEPTDLVNYLLFDGDYCRELIEIGFYEVMSQKEKIIEFITREEQH